MQKIFKRIALVLSLVLAIACLGALTACGDGGATVEDGKYTITVVDQNGNAINGQTDCRVDEDGDTYPIRVQICVTEPNSDEVANCYINVVLGTDGKITYEVGDKLPELQEGERYHIQLNNLADGYTYEESQTFLSAPASLTIVVNK